MTIHTKITAYGYQTANDSEVRYGIFPSRMNRPVCVFSFSSHTSQVSSINSAECIIEAICKEEGFDMYDVTFADLQTHVGFDHWTSGFYQFDQLILNTEKRVSGWKSTECPLGVFQAFKDLIGAFPTLDQVINRSKSCYKSMSEDEFQKERSWAIDWERQMEEIYQDQIISEKARIFTPQEAYQRGYRLAPEFFASESPPREDAPDRLVVNLSGSHLLGQNNGHEYIAANKTPCRFSHWMK